MSTLVFNLGIFGNPTMTCPSIDSNGERGRAETLGCLTPTSDHRSDRQHVAKRCSTLCSHLLENQVIVS
jgi:hypothetical protein